MTTIAKPKQTKRTAAARSKSTRRATSQELFDMIQEEIPDIDDKELLKIEQAA